MTVIDKSFVTWNEYEAWNKNEACGIKVKLGV